MTITLNEEQTRLLCEVVEAGAAASPEHAVDRAVRALHSKAMESRRVHPHVDNLADLILRSPFRGLNLQFEREQDSGRDIQL